MQQMAMSSACRASHSRWQAVGPSPHSLVLGEFNRNMPTSLHCQASCWVHLGSLPIPPVHVPFHVPLHVRGLSRASPSVWLSVCGAVPCAHPVCAAFCMPHPVCPCGLFRESIPWAPVPCAPPCVPIRCAPGAAPLPTLGLPGSADLPSLLWLLLPSWLTVPPPPCEVFCKYMLSSLNGHMAQSSHFYGSKEEMKSA